MSRPVKRANSEREKAQREAVILQAALQQFAERGFHATRMDDIASAAGVGKGTIYLYFSDKESLFRALLTQKIGAQIQRVMSMLDEQVGIEAVLATLAEEMSVLLTASPLPKLLRILIGEAAQFPEMVVFYRQNIIEPTLSMLARRLGGEDVLTTVKLLMAPAILQVLWQEVLFREQAPDKAAVKHLLNRQYQLLLPLCRGGA